MDKDQIIAHIDIMSIMGGGTGVRLTSGDEFKNLPPVARAVLMAAAIQLCGLAIEAILEDHPEDQEEIRGILSAVSIEQKTQVMN